MCNILLGFEVTCSEPLFHCGEFQRPRNQFLISYKLFYQETFTVNYKLDMGIVLGLVHQTIFQIQYSALPIICVPELVTKQTNPEKKINILG